MAVSGDVFAVEPKVEPTVISRRPYSLNLFPLTIEPGHLQTVGGAGTNTVGEDAVAETENAAMP